ncbi:MAG: phage GP46 family protein [Deltaproteobacteria bacterium]|nr:phage GP46 family protein [Deltaproteobacteria bacterium]
MLSLRFDPATRECDLVFDGTQLEEADPLLTAILASIHTDHRVTEGEVPEGVGLGGWWGEAFPEDPADLEGSRLWAVRARGRADSATCREIEGAVRECLAWLLEDEVCTSITVAAAVIRSETIGYTVRAIAADDQREVVFTGEL